MVKLRPSGHLAAVEGLWYLGWPNTLVIFNLETLQADSETKAMWEIIAESPEGGPVGGYGQAASSGELPFREPEPCLQGISGVSHCHLPSVRYQGPLKDSDTSWALWLWQQEEALAARSGACSLKESTWGSVGGQQQHSLQVLIGRRWNCELEGASRPPTTKS